MRRDIYGILMIILGVLVIWNVYQKGALHLEVSRYEIQIQEASSTIGRMERVNTKLLVERLKLREELAAEKRVNKISDQKILDRVNQIIKEDLKKQGE